MEEVGHVNVQEDLESHGFLNFVLYPWYVGLGLEYVGIEPSIVSAEPNERFGRLLGAITRGEAQGDVECLYI